jgi:hypothetical protein
LIYAIINNPDGYPKPNPYPVPGGYGYALEFRVLSRTDIYSTHILPDPFPSLLGAFLSLEGLSYDGSTILLASEIRAPLKGIGAHSLRGGVLTRREV